MYKMLYFKWCQRDIV